jgi:hypothetical protein
LRGLRANLEIGELNNIMRHLDLELEKLEQRIAPGGFRCAPKCGGGGGGSSRSGKSSKSSKSGKSGKSGKSHKSRKGGKC